MQRFYALVIACILLLATAGYAQEKPYALGRATDLVKSFRQQTMLARQQNGIARVVLRTGATDSFPGKVNYWKTENDGHEYLAGEIDSIAGSSFVVRVQGKNVQGHITLRKSKKAWTWYSNANGDVFIKETDINKIICVDYEPQPASASARSTAANNAETITLAAVTALQSYPEANGCVLLDFDGQLVTNPYWNNGKPINALPANLTDSVKQGIWQLISEDFRPFSVNITTSEAVYLSYPANRRMRCIFTPTTTAAPGAGGVAYLNSFTWGNETPCWVFVFSGDLRGPAEGGSHEIGHTFGLGHDGKLKPVHEEYYSGHGNWSPIMGGGIDKPVRQWSKGEYAFPTNQEDDLSIMSGSTNGIGYRIDDHGGIIATASPLAFDSSGGVIMQGIISHSGDLDMFSFTTTGGAVKLVVNPVEKYPNLDIVAVLYNSAGNVITASSPTGLPANINSSLSAGTYFLSIAGAGSGTDYSNYASLGLYRIKGTIAGTKPNTAATFYQRCGYWGTFAKSLPPGAYSTADLAACGINDNDISSFKVNNGYEVLLYNEDYLAGSFTRFTSSAPCLDSFNLNNTASSLRIRSLTNQAPLIAFTKPLAGKSFLAPANIPMHVNASDADGRIIKVDFYKDDRYLGTDSSAPYAYSVHYSSVGSYTIRATASDDRGGISEARLPITITDVPAVTVYQDCDFGGYGTGLTPGAYPLEELQSFGILNDDISSLKVTNGYQVRLYEHDNFGGVASNITADKACLVPDNFNDLTSSLSITAISAEPGATVFPDCHFGGAGIALAPGTYTRSRMHQLGILDNEISSLKVNRGYQVLLYEGDYLTGMSQAFNADNTCLVSTGFNNTTSSIHIQEIVTSVNTLDVADTGLMISPNPVRNELRLISKGNLAGAVIQVYDVMGRNVLTTINTNNRVNVSKLAPGVYSLTVISKGKSVTGRFMK